MDPGRKGTMEWISVKNRSLRGCRPKCFLATDGKMIGFASHNTDDSFEKYEVVFAYEGVIFSKEIIPTHWMPVPDWPRA